MSPKTSLIAVACLALLPAGLRAQSRPVVPAGLEVPLAHKVFLVGHATGTQNYVCLGCPSGAHVWAPLGAPGAVHWLVRQAAGTAVGPTGGRRLAATTYIQRVHTSGGVAPTTSCVVGEKAFVPYTTDYYFYEAR